MGTGSREIFQSISLRAYDKRQTKRVSYEEKLELKRERMEKDSVNELKLWEEATGCFTLDDKADDFNEQLEAQKNANVEDEAA